MSSTLNTALRLVGRLLQGLAVVLIASSIAFLLIKSLKGDEFTMLQAVPGILPERVAQLKALFGNDAPLPQQLWHWLSAAMHGDLLDSKYEQGPVADAIMRAIPNTLKLMSLAYVSSIVGGILLGTWQGANEGTRAQRTSSAVILAAFSLPDFWVAMVLQFLFVSHWHLFSAGGMAESTPDATFVERLTGFVRYTTLPWLSLTIVDVAIFSRFHRAAMREVLGQQYLQTARAKGVSERLVIWKHALRVSVLPMITLAGLYFPALLVGAVLVETVFGWPGVGRLLSEAVSRRDYFLVAGIVVVGSAMTALGSIIADFTRELVDPRLRT